MLPYIIELYIRCMVCFFLFPNTIAISKVNSLRGQFNYLCTILYEVKITSLNHLSFLLCELIKKKQKKGTNETKAKKERKLIKDVTLMHWSKQMENTSICVCGMLLLCIWPRTYLIFSSRSKKIKQIKPSLNDI